MAQPHESEPNSPLRELRKAEVRQTLAMAMAELRIELGRMPNDNELAAYSGVPKRTAARYKESLIGGLPIEFLHPLRAELARRPAQEPNWLALLRSLVAVAGSLPADRLRLAADRTVVSTRAPETAVTRFESWHKVWSPVLTEDLSLRRGAAPTLNSRLEDQLALGIAFAGIEALVSIWQEAGLERNPGDLLLEAFHSIIAELRV